MEATIKLLDRTLEKKALKIVTRGSAAGHWLLSSLNEDSFATRPCQEAYKRIVHIARSKTEIPTWDDLLHDPTLTESTRSALSTYTKKVKTDKDAAKRILRNLDQYRKLRLLYNGLKEAGEGLQRESVDADKLAEKLGELSVKVRSKGDSIKRFAIGAGNNSAQLVKEILKGSALTAIPTGFAAFDRKNRGIFLGSLFVLGATTGGGKCLTGDSIVHTDQGSLRLDEIYAMSGEAINGFQPFTAKVRTHEGTAYTDRSYSTKGRTWKIKTDLGDKVEGLAEHRMWLPDSDGVFDFKRLDKLKVGDWLPKSIGTNLFPRKLPTISYAQPAFDTTHPKTHWDVRYPNKLSAALAELLGWLIAEGDSNKGYHRFCNHDADMMLRVQKLIKTVFGASRDTTSDGVALPLGLLISRFISDLMGGDFTSVDKKVPLIIRRAPKVIQTAFLSALFEGDGCIYRSDSRWRLEYCSISEQLVYEVKSMLENLGILCFIRSGNKQATNGGADQVSVRAFTLEVSAGSYADFAKAIGFVSARKSNELTAALSHAERDDWVFGKNYNHLASGRFNRMPGNDLAIRLYARVAEICAATTNRITDARGIVYSKPYGISAVFRGADHRKKLERGKDLTKYSLDQMVLKIVNAPAPLASRLRADADVRDLTKRLLSLRQYYWSRVESVHATHTAKQVYDLSVPGPHSYHVNGLIGHNTAVALQLMRNFAEHGARVCVVSLEMSEGEVMVRNLSAYSRVEINKLIHAENMTPGEKDKVRKAYAARVKMLKQKDAAEVLNIPTEDLTIDEILFSLKSFGYDVIIVDYISLLKGADGEDQWRQLGNIARFSKIFARNNNCIVMLLAQIGAEGTIRYSKAVQEHANNAWYWVRDQKSKDTRILRIQQMKARNQEDFPFELLEEFQYMSVRDVPDNYKPPEPRDGSNSEKGGHDAPRARRGNDKGSKGGRHRDEPKYKKKVLDDEDEYFNDKDDDL
jgi:replicative DNA helicase